jgi:crotonobetainyl-CoA:carnitine CoA-transferase CaiB-like acyl-CoA transferase
MDDPQVRHLEMVSEAGEGRVLRHPVTFTETPASVRSPAPSPGADTREVLAELGIGEERITELIAGAVVATDRSARAWNV